MSNQPIRLPEPQADRERRLHDIRREAELRGLPSVETEMELAGVREQRDGLKRELQELWARRTNHCCGDS